jgi:hypothetical protein
MKIRSNIKAGGVQGVNHNEKLADDNSSSIEQKKTLGKKLQLGEEIIRELKEPKWKLRLFKETVKVLSVADLQLAAGGYKDCCNVYTY